jgi:LysR family hydrogen peroxide-inducible transcriptional activator
MAITLKQLRYLAAVAEEGHFGRAAAAVNISQPALSVQIRELEAALGARLVERGRREAAMTPTGREIVPGPGRSSPKWRRSSRSPAGTAASPGGSGSA